LNIDSWLVACDSSSRARTGSTSAVRPRPCTWPSFSFVVSATVSGIRRSAAAAHARSGLLAKRFPPRRTPAFIFPAEAATMDE
jgi:hypothetical protein